MRDNPLRETKISKAFVNILATLSILGFISIISYSLVNIDISKYMDPLWLIILGTGFIIESNPKKILHTIKHKLEQENFTAMTTLIIGCLAIISGILSIPQIGIESSVFLAIKGLMSIMAIAFIVIQTWVLK